MAAMCAGEGESSATSSNPNGLWQPPLSANNDNWLTVIARGVDGGRPPVVCRLPAGTLQEKLPLR